MILRNSLSASADVVPPGQVEQQHRLRLHTLGEPIEVRLAR
jgi:hypothetical protein